jgi:hypothetical protein
MGALLLRGWPVSFAAGSLLTAMLSGCALDTEQSDLGAQSHLAAVEPQPPVQQQPAPAKQKQVAPARKQAAATPVAKEPPSRQAGGDETSCTKVEDCASVLKAMVSSPDRSWLHRPATPAVLANGVRLFAYRALIPKLDCGELAKALTEVETAAHTLSHGVAGLQPEPVSRAKSLSLRVGDELRAERASRCAAQAKETPPSGSVAPAPQG